jgi:hypothetical protein
MKILMDLAMGMGATGVKDLAMDRGMAMEREMAVEKVTE